MKKTVEKRQVLKRYELNDFLKARGVTQQQLAKVLGVTQAAVSKWAKRERRPSLEMVLQMAIYLQKPLVDIFFCFI